MLTAKRMEECKDYEDYFSQWFIVISKEKAKEIYDRGEKERILILNPVDGTDRYFDFDSWGKMEHAYPDAMFGLDKD